MAEAEGVPTQQKALAILETIRNASKDDIADSEVRSLLTPELLTEILGLAWAYQFEDERTVPRAKLKQLVSDAIESHELEGERK